MDNINYTSSALGTVEGRVEPSRTGHLPGSTQTPLLGSVPTQGVFYTEDDHTLSVGTVEATLLELGLTGYQRVHRLMQVMEQPTPSEVAWPSEDVFRLRVKLDLEEQFEKLVDGYYLADPNMILDGAADVEVVGIGSIVAFGIDYDLAIAEVDRSNLSKLGEDGKPIKNEFGKFLKGPNYTPPNLVQFLHGLQNVPAPYDTKAIVSEELANVVIKYAMRHWDMFHDTYNGLRSVLLNPGATTEDHLVAVERAALDKRKVSYVDVDEVSDAVVDGIVHGAKIQLTEYPNGFEPAPSDDPKATPHFRV